MTQVQIVYWRDIPASVQVRRGRREKVSRELPLRFTEAIDMAAMRAGMAGTDDYLNEWKRGPAVECDDDMERVADETCARLDAEYPKERLVALALRKGVDKETGECCK